jgi:hypothetical protein
MGQQDLSSAFLDAEHQKTGANSWHDRFTMSLK